MNINNYLVRKKTTFILFIAVILTITYGASILTQFDPVKGISSVPRAVEWAAQNFYPDAKAMSRLPQIMKRLWDTIMMSVAAAALGSLAAVVFAVLGSTSTMKNTYLAAIPRFVATLFRNIDVSVWSMVLLFSFGQTEFTGLLALFFTSFGFLTRAFMETIDEVSADSVEALQATGAGMVPIICRAVIPSSIPQIMSWLLYMIETNIRSATLVGLLTGTGIGFSFDLYYKSLNYNSASLVVIAIVMTIVLIELISNWIRKMVQ